MACVTVVVVAVVFAFVVVLLVNRFEQMKEFIQNEGKAVTKSPPAWPWCSPTIGKDTISKCTDQPGEGFVKEKVRHTHIQ